MENNQPLENCRLSLLYFLYVMFPDEVYEILSAAGFSFFFFLVILHTQPPGKVGKQLNQTCKRQKAIYFVYLFLISQLR